MMEIKHNPSELTDDEQKIIDSAPWYVYLYGVGLILLPGATWDCSDTVGAKQYLDNLKITEL